MNARWPVARLGEHVDLLPGFAFKSAGFTDSPEDVRLLRGANIGQGQLKWHQERRWPRGEAESYAKFMLAAEDVVLAMDRPWIEAGLKWAPIVATDLPMLLVQRVARLRPLDTIDRDFLRCLVGSPHFSSYIKAIVTGVNVPHISPDQIKSFEFPLPDLLTQRAVGEVVRAFDDLIENNRRRIEILEEMARLLYREWFVHFRFPGHEDRELVDSELGPIPEGWKVVALGEIASVNKGLSYKGVHLSGSGLPMANLKCLSPSGGFSRRGTKDYDGPFKERHAIVPGDIVVANTDLTQAGNVIGSAGMIPNSGFEAGGLLSHHLFRIRPESSPFTVVRSLQSDRLRALARSVASGTTVLGMRSDDFERFPLAWPPVDVRAKFETIQEPMHGLKENLEDQNEVLREARDLLLPRLVSGELDVLELDLDGVSA